MNKFTVTLAGALERAEHVIGDVAFGFDLEARVRHVAVELGGFGRWAKRRAMRLLPASS